MTRRTTTVRADATNDVPPTGSRPRDPEASENGMQERADASAANGRAPNPETDAGAAGARRDPSDVRAGPGDAGGQRSPRVVPQDRDTDPRARARALPIVLGILLGVVVVLALRFML